MSEKMWGDEPFWGLGYDWDPDWVLTDRQIELRETLISLCEKEMRANAKRSDDELLFPRRNLELLGEHGFLALTVPEEYGGLGENHVAFAMACETIARYGCASTAMCYVMHMGAVAALMLRPTPEIVDKYIRPLNSGLIGTLSYSDPETGSHFWYPVSSRAERLNGGYRINKKASWTTSGGFADFYVLQTTSPDFKGYDDLSVFVVDKEFCEAQPSLWDALGLRGNQSGAISFTDVEIPGTQIVGPEGDGATSNDEAVDPWFLIGSSSVWNGLALGAVDIAKRHTTRKRHVDVGMRVADYPTIQDYVGQAVMETNASRLFVYSVAQAFDKATDNNTKLLEPGELARGNFLHWAWQIKFVAAQNTAHVVDKMLHACGGSGYKRDMELERYLRDAKAGWVMGPTNEVLRQFVGKAVLLGFESLDYWNQSYNRRAVENEVKKLDAAAQARARGAAARRGRRGGGEGAREGVVVAVAGRPRLLVPGLLPRDPGRETYRVRAGRRRRRSPSGRTTGSRSATSRAASARIVAGLAGPDDVVELFGPESPPGAEETFRADRDAVVRVAAPGGLAGRRGRHPRLRPAARDRPREACPRRPRAGAAGAARRAAARLPGRPRLGARVRGQGRRVHPGDRRAGPPVLRLPRLQRAEAAGGQGARPRRDRHALADGQRLPRRRASTRSSSTTTSSRSSRSCATPSAATTRSASPAPPSTTRTWATSATSTARTTSTRSCCRTRSSRARAGRRSTSSSTPRFDAHNQYLVDEPWSRPGDYVLLRATTDLVCLSSACPDDIDPANAWNPTEVHVRVYPATERFSAAIAHRVTPDAEPKLTKETGFHEKTSALTSRFTEYNGYWLPTSYDNLGAVAEYWACREHAAVMDLSPLRKFEILGPDAEALLQATMTRDIRRLADGQVVYTAMCNETGGMLDDGTVFRIAPDNFRFVGGAEYDGVWLREQAERLGLRVWVKESTDDLHNIAVQGPASREILSTLVWTPPAQTPFAELKWFRFSVGRLGGPQGLPLIASRTGYSGELGYELFCHPKDAPAL